VFKKPKKELRAVDATHLVVPARAFGTEGKNRYFISPMAKVMLPPRMKMLVLEADPAKQSHLEEVAQTLELII